MNQPQAPGPPGRSTEMKVQIKKASEDRESENQVFQQTVLGDATRGVELRVEVEGGQVVGRRPWPRSADMRS